MNIDIRGRQDRSDRDRQNGDCLPYIAALVQGDSNSAQMEPDGHRHDHRQQDSAGAPQVGLMQQSEHKAGAQ
jgi:hypothetical protein